MKPIYTHSIKNQEVIRGKKKYSKLHNTILSLMLSGTLFLNYTLTKLEEKIKTSFYTITQPITLKEKGIKPGVYIQTGAYKNPDNAILSSRKDSKFIKDRKGLIHVIEGSFYTEDALEDRVKEILREQESVLIVRYEPNYDNYKLKPENVCINTSKVCESKNSVNRFIDSKNNIKKEYLEYIEEYCKKHKNIEPELVVAVILVESGFNHKAISNKGAIGLMQLMPDTAKDLGVNPYLPRQNIYGGIRYLSTLIEKYEDDLEKAIAAYNAGPNNVETGRWIKFPETRRYVRDVLNNYNFLKLKGLKDIN